MNKCSLYFYVFSILLSGSAIAKDQKQDACIKVLGAGIYNAALEDVCKFNGGVKEKLLAMYNEAGCKMIVPQKTVERIAADHVKAMMKTYEESAVASGLNVITDRPYMHYAWHPKWQEAKAADYAKSIGLDLPITTVPYNQFHSRLVGAQPMVPDVYHSVQSYVPMAEKILGWRSFWNKQGPKDASWYKHMMSCTVQQNPALRSMWNAIKDASLLTEQMTVDK